MESLAFIKFKGNKEHFLECGAVKKAQNRLKPMALLLLHHVPLLLWVSKEL